MVSRHHQSVVVRRILVCVVFVLMIVTLCTIDVQMLKSGADSEISDVEGRGLNGLQKEEERASSPIPADTGKSPQTSRRLSYHDEEESYFFPDWEQAYDDDDNSVRTLISPGNDINNNQKTFDDHRLSSSPSPSRTILTRRLPHAIIIGVKKGGTRALLEILRLHPDVRAPGPEPHFFDRHFHKGIKWYRRQMPLSWEGQITVEKTPSYFVTPEVPSRIHDAFGEDIRLLVVVRDPVTRAVSDYTQASSKRPMDTRTFEEMAFLNFSTGLVDTNWSAIKIGVYARHLQRWLSYFPLSQFHFVSGERLISDPVAELESVQKFLGLRNLISDRHFFFNQTKGFPCLRRSAQSDVPHCLGKTKGRSHPHIPPSAEQRLRDFYRPFNQKFYRIVGRNFEWS